MVCKLDLVMLVNSQPNCMLVLLTRPSGRFPSLRTHFPNLLRLDPLNPRARADQSQENEPTVPSSPSKATLQEKTSHSMVSSAAAAEG